MIKKGIARFLTINLDVAPEVRTHYLELPNKDFIFPLMRIRDLMRITQMGEIPSKIKPIQEKYTIIATEAYKGLREPILFFKLKNSMNLEKIMKNNGNIRTEAQNLYVENKIVINQLKTAIVNPLVRSAISYGYSFINNGEISNSSLEILAYGLAIHPEEFGSIEEFEEQVNMPKKKERVSLFKPKKGKWSAKDFLEKQPYDLRLLPDIKAVEILGLDK